jgi:hypothetical protein
MFKGNRNYSLERRNPSPRHQKKKKKRKKKEKEKKALQPPWPMDIAVLPLQLF